MRSIWVNECNTRMSCKRISISWAQLMNEASKQPRNKMCSVKMSKTISWTVNIKKKKITVFFPCITLAISLVCFFVILNIFFCVEYVFGSVELWHCACVFSCVYRDKHRLDMYKLQRKMSNAQTNNNKNNNNEKKKKKKKDTNKRAKSKIDSLLW